MLEKLKNIGWRYISAGAAASVIGLCFLFFQSSPSALTVMIGILFALLGACAACLCIFKKSKGASFVAKIVAAALFFTVGVLVIAFNDASFAVLTAALCLALTVNGAFNLHLSVRAKTLSVDGWWIITAISASVVISSFLLARISPESARGTAIWLGITALADAACSVLAAFWSARCRTAEKASIYYEVYKDIESTK